MEARIRQLDHMLKYAKVGAASTESGVVAPGMVVKATILGDEETFLIGSREIASGDIDVYSEASPLGQAILGHKIGETVSYLAPNGRSISVEILAAEPYAP